MRDLVLVLGDQLDAASSAFAGFDPRQDAVWMAEVVDESTHVRSHKARIAMFLAAMRHFRAHLEQLGRTVHYRALDSHGHTSLGDALQADLALLRPRRIVMSWPGEHRVLAMLRATAAAAGVELDVRPDTHFLCTPDEFAEWAAARRSLRMEHFYRWMRQRHGLLLDSDGPCGGRWNFDAENRASFGREGPGFVPEPVRFPPDTTTRAVLQQVADRFADHPGSLDHFDWPVRREQALHALDDFVEHRLPDFGRWQDAMWTGEPWLYHARIAAALNLKLLSPRETCDAAERAFRAGKVDLAAAEGFVRQVAGWREYVRGVYWREMPAYASRNALGAHHPLPPFYWTGDTDMACVRECVGQTLRLGYAHHIQRLMVTGLFAQLWGAKPQEVHEWYLAVYVDAVEWVELPNTLGMSQYADGGLLASKPYVATGKYIERMSDYCRGCRYDPSAATGDRACPFTTLYWDFLARHRERFARHPRMALQVRNLERLTTAELRAIAERAAQIRQESG